MQESNGQNKLTSKTEPEAWKQGADLTVTRKEGEPGQWWKEGEGTRQRTRMNDPWARTTVWGLTVGAEVGWVKEDKGEDNSNRITIKN